MLNNFGTTAKLLQNHCRTISKPLIAFWPAGTRWVPFRRGLVGHSSRHQGPGCTGPYTIHIYIIQHQEKGPSRIQHQGPGCTGPYTYTTSGPGPTHIQHQEPGPKHILVEHQDPGPTHIQHQGPGCTGPYTVYIYNIRAQDVLYTGIHIQHQGPCCTGPYTYTTSGPMLYWALHTIHSTHIYTLF